MTLLRALVATVLAAGATVLVAPAPALAATCGDGNGVSVVVDYRELGGSTVTACAPNGGGKSAAAVFAEASVAISYATRQPGFVCRVNGVPAADPCVNASPADAFWGLWYSDGTTPWTYSSSGVGSLTVPAGGSVGWSWQQDRAAGQAVPPGVAAPIAPATPSPTVSPTSSPTSSPTQTPSSSPSPTRSPEPTASPTSKSRDAGSRPGSRSGRGSEPTTENPGADERGTSPATASPSPATASSGPSEAKKQRQKAGKALESTPETASPATTDEAEAATEPPGAAEAGVADEPTRIPAALTWGVLALLGAAALVSAVVSRRRRSG